MVQPDKHPNSHARLIRATSTAGTPTLAFGQNGTDDEGDRESAMVTRPAWTRTDGINGSPLHRAGYLSPRSYSSSSSFPHLLSFVPHSTEDIRANTMELSDLLLNPSASSSAQGQFARGDFIFPAAGYQPPPHESAEMSQGRSRPQPGPSTSVRPSIDLTDPATTTTTDPSTSTSPSTAVDPSTSPTDNTSTRTPTVAKTHHPHLSNLSILLARQQEGDPTQAGGPLSSPTPTAEHPPHIGRLLPSASESAKSTPPPNRASVYDALLAPSFSPASRTEQDRADRLHPSGEGERTPLLPPSVPALPSYTAQPLKHMSKLKSKHLITKIASSVKEVTSKDSLRQFAVTSVKSIPAVLLGTLLNILDGVSYGMIIFPTGGVFADLGGMGVSMFFVSTVIAQLTYTFGASGFAGANGSMMIEVVPFFHIIASTIAMEIGEENPNEIIATTLVAFALSSILTGLAFALLGALRLGALLGFFPRHILVGCIGGVGAFLIETGLTVSTRISDDDFSYTFATLKFFFQPSNLALWLPALGLAVLLRVITHRYHHQLIFPMYFFLIPVVFYIVVAAARLDLGVLRHSGWLFNMGNSADRSWYEFYTYFDFGNVKMGPLWSTLPTQFALLFFNILHPPLNVPALAVSLIEDVDTNKELVAHGYSNLLAGIVGTVPNYLVYVNTLLFYRVGGGTRIAGFLLAAATGVLLLIGTGPIAYIPVMLVGSLIFVLGFDLVKEALWDTRHRVNKSEYLTIASIVVVMTVWDFVIGVLFGIVVSCFFFVVQNSQVRSIRSIYTGDTAMSTVRRPGAHRAYIREVSRQTTILRLQGFLFFGTITYVEETIKNIIEDPSWQRRPVRFLVVDLTLVAGVDMSSAEAFVRVHRMLSAKNVVLVFCGFVVESAIGKALESVGVLAEDFVELFTTFNDAMEWTENAYLRAWFRSQKAAASAVVLPGRQDADIHFYQSSPAGSHRHSHLRDVGLRTMRGDTTDHLTAEDSAEPYTTLVRAFSSYGEVDRERLQPLVPYLERSSVLEGLVLWKQDQDSDGLYLIESGVLRASYKFAEHVPPVEESMVPGTLAGELSALTGLSRNATVVVERQAVLWKLSTASLRRLESDDPTLARTFVQLVLKAAKMDYDILLSALATR